MKIQIIQGDTKVLYLSVANDTTTRDNTPIVIDKIVFTCVELGIEKNFTYDSALSKYLLSFTSTETSKMRIGRSTYDVTFYTGGSQVNTAVFNGTLEVLEKVNVVKGVS